jgi:hypothetical protein
MAWCSVKSTGTTSPHLYLYPAWICPRFCVLLSCLGRGPAMGLSSVRGIVRKCVKGSQFQRLILNRNRPEGVNRETCNCIQDRCPCVLTVHHAMKASGGSGGIVPSILHLGTRLKCVVNFMSRSLYPQGKSLWYPLDRRLGGLQSRFGRGGEEKNSQPLPGLGTPDHPALTPALYP